MRVDVRFDYENDPGAYPDFGTLKDVLSDILNEKFQPSKIEFYQTETIDLRYDDLEQAILVCKNLSHRKPSLSVQW
jgi:hypothetical protein